MLILLSVRQQQVTDLVMQGMSNKAIGWELHLTIGTVKEYLFHIFKIVGVGNRTELAMWNRNKHEVSPESLADQELLPRA